jgi:tetratricopeptide (TPR) repeat protein
LLWLASFGLLLALAAKGLRWQAGKDKQAQQRQALALGLLGLLVQNLFDRNLRLSGSGFYFWAYLGLMAEPGKPLPWPKDIRWRQALGVILLALGLGLLPYLLRPVMDLGHLGQGEKVLGSADQAKAQEAGLREAAQGAKDPGVHLQLADSLAAQQRFAEAADEYAAALGLDPRSRPAALNLGNCRFKLNQLDRAVAAYQRALSIDPGSADAHFDLGYALYHQRRMDQALAEFDKALALDPAYAPARKMKEMLLQ